MTQRGFFLSVSCILWLLTPTPTPALEVGDKAPSLQTGKWLSGKGLDPSTPDGTNAYVVELWATWCPPCRMSIPHMNRIQTRFAGRSLVIMGISSEEEKTVSDFIKTNTMKYAVGIDPKGAITRAYKGEEDGIPRAIVIDKTGTVVWIGHPMDGLDRVADKVLNGLYDASLFKRVAAAHTEAEAAMQIKDIPAVEAAVDKMIKLEPDNPKHHLMKLNLLTQMAPGTPPAKIQTLFQDWARGCNEYADGLRILVMAMRMQTYALRDPELTLSSASKALALAGETDPDFASMMALVYADLGMLPRAMEVLKAALASPTDAASKPALQAQLDYYTRARRLQTP